LQKCRGSHPLATPASQARCRQTIPSLSPPPPPRRSPPASGAHSRRKLHQPAVLRHEMSRPPLCAVVIAHTRVINAAPGHGHNTGTTRAQHRHNTGTTRHSTGTTPAPHAHNTEITWARNGHKTGTHRHSDTDADTEPQGHTLCTCTTHSLFLPCVYYRNP